RIYRVLLSFFMKIRNVIHRGLRRFIEEDEGSGLPPAVAPKIRKIVSFLSEHGTRRRAAVRACVETPPDDRRPERRMEPVRHQNWRITFQIDREEIEIIDLN